MPLCAEFIKLKFKSLLVPFLYNSSRPVEILKHKIITIYELEKDPIVCFLAGKIN